MALVVLLGACRGPRRSDSSDARDASQPAHVERELANSNVERELANSNVERELPNGSDGAVQVRLTWRLFETQHWLKDGVDQQSAVFELLVSGGTPGRVALGRRDSSGCKLSDRSESAQVLSEIDCRQTRARVFRSAPGELRAVVGDPDAAATIRIPVDAEVAVDPELARIPDEAPGP